MYGVPNLSFQVTSMPKDCRYHLQEGDPPHSTPQCALPSKFLTGSECLHCAEISMYVCGFPCTPYSLLSNTRLMLKDPNSAQLFKALKRVKRYQPKACLSLFAFVSAQICIFENVLGFGQLVKPVTRMMRLNLPQLFD